MTLRGPLALLVVAGALLAFTGVGCKRRKHLADDAEAYDVVRTPDGGETRVHNGPGPIPPEFPVNIALYPGTMMKSIARTEESVVIAFSTEHPLEDVRRFYRAQSDYAEVSDVEVNGMRVLHLTQTASGKEFDVIGKIGTAAPTEVFLVAPR